MDDILRVSLLQDRMPTIQIDDNAGRLLQLVTTLHRPSRVLEIGTLFGYSLIYIARGLPPGGRVVGLEIDAKAAAVARKNIAQAGLEDVAEVIVIDAREYLCNLEEQSLDMVFIDGNKEEYVTYLKLLFNKIRPGGLIIADDVFAEPAASEGISDDERTELRRYCSALSRSSNILSAFVGTENGLMIGLKL